jgi:hypothetical protein
MYGKILTEADAAEFKRIAREHDALQAEATALVEKRELSFEEMDRLLAITSEQVELHRLRMRLLR